METHFIKWSKEFAYYLGYLWSDGYVSRTGIVIKIIEEDGNNILEDLRKIDFIKFNVYRRNDQSNNRNSKPTISINFCNAKLYDSFFSHYYNNKSIKAPIELLKIIPEYLRRYFYLGLIDGDGCFYISKNYKTKQFVIASSYEQEWFHIESIFKELSITQFQINKIINKKGKSSNLRINKYDEIYKLYNYLYPNGFEMGLKRKYNKCKLIIDNKPVYSLNKSKIEVQELIKDINNGDNITQLLEKYKCSKHKIYNMCVKYEIPFFNKRVKKTKIKNED